MDSVDLLYVKYDNKAWEDPWGKWLGGYLIGEWTTVHDRSYGSVERYDGYQTRIDKVWVDDTGRLFQEMKNYIDYTGGTAWRAWRELDNNLDPVASLTGFRWIDPARHPKSRFVFLGEPFFVEDK